MNTIISESDNELRNNIIEYTKRCLALDIQSSFLDYTMEYHYDTDILELTYINNDTSNDIIVPNIFDKVSTDCCSNYNLKKITFGDRLKTIGWGAFRYISSLNCIDLSDCKSLMIEQEAFAKCINLKEVKCNDIKSIGYMAFYNCESLQYINLSNTENIEELAFSNCSSLQYVDLSNIKNINKLAFYNC